MQSVKKIKTRSKDFKVMVTGQVISILGSALLRFALSLYILDTTGRADIYAVLYAISNIPLIFSPIGGALADRFNKRSLMVIFDCTSGIVTGIYFIFLLKDNISVVLVGTIMFLLSSISAMYEPAVTASIPLLVDEGKLESSNGIVNAVHALSNVAAPMVGGVIYGILGIDFIVASSIFAFLISAAIEMFLHIPYSKIEHEGNKIAMIIDDIKNGFFYTVKRPLVFRVMILGALLNLLLTPFFVVGSPVILRIAMRSTDTMYGIGMSSINLATIIGALSIGFFTKKFSMSNLYKWIMIIALFFIPIAISLTPIMTDLGYYPSYALFLLSSIPIAMIMTMISIFIIAKVQRETPNENLGKVMSIITGASQCAAPAGQIIYGMMFEKFSVEIFIPALITLFAMILLSMFTYKVFASSLGYLCEYSK